MSRGVVRIAGAPLDADALRETALFAAVFLLAAARSGAAFAAAVLPASAFVAAVFLAGPGLPAVRFAALFIAPARPAADALAIALFAAK